MQSENIKHQMIKLCLKGAQTCPLPLVLGQRSKSNMLILSQLAEPRYINM